MAHLLLRSAPNAGSDLPELERACSVFTTAFLRAVAVPGTNVEGE